MNNWRSTTYIEIQNQLRAYFAALYHHNMPYLPTMLCTHQGQWYICHTPTSGTFNPLHWHNIPTPTATQHGNYNPQRTYNTAQYCLHLGVLYQCLTNGTTGTFDPTQWQSITTYGGTTQFRQLRWIDYFNNQYNYINSPNQELPFPLPAIFIELHATEWKNLTTTTQTGTCQIRIHVVLESYHEAYHTSYDQAQALDHFNYLEQVQLALQGFVGTYFTALSRTNEQLDTDHSNVIVHLFEYQTTITDTQQPPNTTTSIPITDVQVNPEYDDTPVNTFDRLGDQTQQVLQNTQNHQTPTPQTDNPYFVND